MVVNRLEGYPVTISSKQINVGIQKIQQKCPIYENGGSTVGKLGLYFCMRMEVVR